MDLSPLVNGALLALFAVVFTWLFKGRFDAIDRRFDAVDRRFDAVDRRFDGVDKRLDRLEAENSEMRSMIMQLAIALGVRPRPQTG